MDFNRAEEILNNTGNNIEVTYKNSSVWLQSANIKSNTVMVKDLESNNVLEVSPKELVERKEAELGTFAN